MNAKKYNELGAMSLNEVQINAIGSYPVDPKKPPRPNYADNLLNENGKKELYKGIDEYKKQHAQKVANFIIKHPHPEQFDLKNDNSDPKFFRKQLANLCQKIQLDPNGSISEEQKKHIPSNPSKATTTMEDLLGKEGIALAKLALEEEMNSKEYMDEVFNESIHEYDGPKWKTPISAFVGGPSSSGKTTAATSTFNEVSKSVSNASDKKSASNEEKNYQADIDGALSRGRFVQSLLKRTAEGKGYCGISDLHNKSKILGQVKVRLYNAAFATQDLSTCIPETFSDITRPKKLLWFIDTLAKPGRLPAFGRVSCDSEAVKKMGEGRAYTSNPNPTAGVPPLEMNKGTDYESKKYDSKGYLAGNIGSQIAESIYQSIRGPESLLLNNDLVLKKENPKDSNEWVDAKSNEEGAILVSQRVYDEWAKNPPENRNPLNEYIKAKGRLPPEIQKPVTNPAIELIANVMLKLATHLNNRRIDNINSQIKNSNSTEIKQELETKRQAYLDTQTAIKTGLDNSNNKLNNNLKQFAANNIIHGLVKKVTEQLKNTFFSFPKSPNSQPEDHKTLETNPPVFSVSPVQNPPEMPTAQNENETLATNPVFLSFPIAREEVLNELSMQIGSLKPNDPNVKILQDFQQKLENCEDNAVFENAIQNSPEILDALKKYEKDPNDYNDDLFSNTFLKSLVDLNHSVEHLKTNRTATATVTESSSNKFKAQLQQLKNSTVQVPNQEKKDGLDASETFNTPRTP